MNGVKSETIKRMLETLNTFNATPECGTTRLVFSDEEMGARAYIKGEMERIGLQVEEDAIGNIFGVLEGENPALPKVWSGSHIDTVLNAGMFDGMAGVVCAIEALRAIKESGLKHKRSIAALVYTSEEPTRFNCCCLGSRAMSGHLTLETTKELFDGEGASLHDVLVQRGYDLSRFGEIVTEQKDVFAAVELHIEQNSALEKMGLPIGVVKYICAPTNLQITVHGRQSHAGGTSMTDRQDAFMASAEMALWLEKLARESKSEYTTGTVGVIHVFPGASNVIPGEVTFSIDIRDCDGGMKQQMLRELYAGMDKIAARRGVTYEVKVDNDDTPIKCDEALTAVIEACCKQENIPYAKLISGAYHDSLFVGEFAPVAMIFVPSKNGISHSKEEWTEFEDLKTGCEVLADSLVRIANQA